MPLNINITQGELIILNICGDYNIIGLASGIILFTGTFSNIINITSLLGNGTNIECANYIKSTIQPEFHHGQTG